MSEEARPLVSIVVPSYNQGQYIEDTLLSILGQDYPHIEIIVVDGASTDGTRETLHKYAGRISFVSEPDHGQADAVNKGFRMARGEVIGWLNSDDIYPDKRAICRIVDAFREDPRADFVYGDFVEIDAKNHMLIIYRRPGYSFTRLLRIGYISQPATFFRQRVLESMKLRDDLTYAMDLDFWLRAHRLGFKFTHISFLIAGERLHADAKCVRSADAMALEARAVRELHGARFNLLFKALRFVDRVLLYAFRVCGLWTLLSYRREPQRLTIPLALDGAMLRTLLFRVR